MKASGESQSARRQPDALAMGTVQQQRKPIRRSSISKGRRSEAKNRVQIQSILVPLDFSPLCTKALSYAAALARQYNAAITLLYVIEPVSMPEFAGAYPLVIENDELVTACKARLLRAAQECAAAPLPIADTVVRQGPPHLEIAEAARALNADLIVISTHGYSGVSHFLLGSAAERVVRVAPCPVLVVREKEHEFISSETNSSAM